MTKNEFMDYLEYLKKALGIEIPTDKEILNTWFIPFATMHIDIAKKMASLYLYKEKGYFQLSKLLEYKSVAMNGVSYEQKQSEVICPICKNTGYVQIEIQIKNHDYLDTVFKRCFCKVGSLLSSNTNQISEAELKLMVRNGNGVYGKRSI